MRLITGWWLGLALLGGARPPGALAAPPPHPRLLLTDAQLAAAKAAAPTDPLRAALHARIVQEAEAELAAPPPRHILKGKELLDQSRGAIRSILTEAMAWRLTGDARFADHARRDLLAAAAFPDWNPQHFLDVGEMSFAVAVGYDWLWPRLSEADRAVLAGALREKALSFAAGAYAGGKPADPHLWWAAQTTNWNQVCNGGLLTAALALADSDAELAQRVVAGVRRSLAPAMAEYRPDGAYPEGPGYWTYGTTYNVIALAEMEAVLGTDFGLGRSPAFDRTDLYRMAVDGPTGLGFNYADSPARLQPSPALTWLARRYDHPEVLAYSRALLAQSLQEDRTSDRFFALQAVWFPDQASTPVGRAPLLDLHFRGIADLALFRSAWNDPRALFVGFKAGTNSFHHAHLDLGSFVFDADGQRWSLDPGGDSYRLPGYFDFDEQRWQYLRTNNHGHSTVAPGDAVQRRAAVAPIIAFGSAPKRAFAVADLTSAYPGAARKLLRGIALLDRRRVLIQDEFTPAGAGLPLNWRMLTEARAEVAADGRSATLREGGRVLRAALLGAPGARFHAAPARPPSAAENQNEGMSILMADLPPGPAGAAVRLAVLLTPLDSARPVLPDPALMPLAEWGGPPPHPAEGRPYSAASPWNTPLPARPEIAPDSDRLIRSLGKNFGASVSRFTLPVYEVSPTQPTHAVRVSKTYSIVTDNNSKLERVAGPILELPIPESALPAAGSDAQIILWNPATGDEWGFWQARRDAAGNWSAVNGYRYNTAWSAEPPRTAAGEPFGSRGAGVPYLTGLIRPWEVAQGKIEHAIAFAYQDASPSWVAPATKSDGKGSGMPQGTRIQLDPGFDERGLTRTGRIVAEAMKRYGMILIDSAGHPKIYAEYQGTAHWSADPARADYWSEQVVGSIPFSEFRVVK